MIRFFVADSAEIRQNDTVLNELEAEQARHGDLVFLHGINDTYENLHLKVRFL